MNKEMKSFRIKLGIFSTLWWIVMWYIFEHAGKIPLGFLAIIGCVICITYLITAQSLEKD